MKSLAVAALPLTLAVALVAAPFPAEPQQAARFPRIGVLWPVSDDSVLEGFRKGLRDIGYVEGRNVVIEYRYARGKDELLPDLAAELVRLNVDVILTWGVVAARVAKRATTTIPIVNGSMSDPVRAGLVESLARPGGNLTGLTSFSREMSGKRLELIRELVPGLSHVAVLSTANPTSQFALKETEVAARSLGLRVRAVEVRGPDDFADAFSAMVRERAGALVMTPELLFNQHEKRIVGLAAKHRLPAMHVGREFVDAGGLMSYAPSFADMFRRAASYVDKILKGTKPAELPIEAPTKFDLVINMKTAKALGLTIPQSVLVRADHIIE
jgi:putative ABC transport system substrate-binding protein